MLHLFLCCQLTASIQMLLHPAHTASIPQGLKLCAADHARQAISADGTRPTLAQRLAIGGLAGAIAQACVSLGKPALLANPIII